MQMRLKDVHLHGRITCDDFAGLGFVGDIENGQGGLYVQKRTAHEELLGRKSLLHIPDMFAKFGLLSHGFPGLPSWARGIDHGKHYLLSFSNHCCPMCNYRTFWALPLASQLGAIGKNHCLLWLGLLSFIWPTFTVENQRMPTVAPSLLRVLAARWPASPSPQNR